MQATFPDIIYIVVSIVCWTFVTSDDSKGGRQILGLSKAWTVFRRAGRGIEVGLRGTHKVGVP